MRHITKIMFLMIFQIINEGKISASINQIMSISYFPIAFLMLKPLPLNKIILISKRTIQFSLPLLIVEAYFRLMNPIWQPSEFVDYNTENLFFYAFKINSIT